MIGVHNNHKIEGDNDDSSDLSLDEEEEWKTQKHGEENVKDDDADMTQSMGC